MPWPRDGSLTQRAGAPDQERVAGPFGVTRSPVLLLQNGRHLGNVLGTLGEILFEPLQLPPKIGKKGLAVDHDDAACVPLSPESIPAPPISQAPG